MNINPSILTSTYLLARTAGAVVTLVTILLVACPWPGPATPGAAPVPEKLCAC